MARKRANTVTVTRTVEFEVECEVEIEPGERAIMWGDNAHPGCAASGEILSAVIEGTKINVLAALSGADEEAFEAEAVTLAGEDEEDSRGAAEDDEADRRRDERRGL